MENIPISLVLLGSAGIFITIVICITGKRIKKDKKYNINFDYIVLFKISISIVSLVYLFRTVMMFITGMISNLYIPAIIGGAVALLPVAVTFLLKHSSANELKVR